MRTLLLRVAPVLRLTRVTSAFAAVANVWFVILWSRAEADHEHPTPELDRGPLWILLAGGAMMALGLYSFGASLNDVLDAKRDRTLRPDRPLASGRLTIEAAMTMVVCMLIASVAGAALFGTGAVLMTLLVIAAVLVFNSAGRFVPGIGLVLLGLIYAGHMVVPNIFLSFVWPVWLIMTHSLVIAAVTHVIGRRVPRLSTRAALAAVLGWAFWSGLIVWIGWERTGRPAWAWPDWVDPALPVWPLALTLPLGIWCWIKVRQHGVGPRAADKIGRYGSLWVPLYGAAWLLGAGHVGPGALLLGLAAATLVGINVLRTAYSLVEEPLGYRR